MTDAPDPRLPDPAESATDADASTPTPVRRPTRRQVLQWAALGTVGAGAAGVGAWKLLGSDDAGSGPSAAKAGLADRILVVIEMGGGNDGWSTFVPFESGHYRDLRPTLALGADQVIDWGNGWGVNKRLKGLVDRGLTLVEGIGTNKPNLSHFEMADRWARGTPDIDSTAKGGAFATGFLGNLCDAVGTPGQLTGVSLHWGDHPGLRTRATAATGLGEMSGNPLANPDVAAELRDLLADLTSGKAPAALEETRRQLAGVVDVLDLVNALPAAEPGYPDTPLGRQLAFASRLIFAQDGIRVIHVPMGIGTFDTHARHAETHAGLMVEVNDAVSAFVDELRARGAADQVLVATTSEFGRRTEEHDGGLDHGTAGVMMMLGPTRAGLHGEPASLTKFDDLDNLVATAEFDSYYATLATWLEIDPQRVVPPRTSGKVASPIAGVLR